MTLRVIAYGGGVQSTALCVLATQGKLDGIMGGKVDAALFALVGENSEKPQTLDYVRTVMTPWAAAGGLPIHIVQKTVIKTGQPIDLYDYIIEPGRRSYKIPLFGSNGGMAFPRSCTHDWKVDPQVRWAKAHGATEDDPAVVAVGISVDEMHRANPNKANRPTQRVVYPLLDLRLNRADCIELIRSVNLPVPPKSACYFCPFHSDSSWGDLRRDEPLLFEKAALLEDIICGKERLRGSTPLYLTRFGRPIREAVRPTQEGLFVDGTFGNGECDEGYCFV